jgi:HPt (histidine-containing phosphotransfer) domain-containing protein
MATRSDSTTSVTVFADHEVIKPPHQLRKAVAQVADAHDDPIARAEAALAELSGEFANWMNAECERLEAARQDAKRVGFSKKTHEALFRAAHDIKGEAATFGYPAVAVVANSLCRLLEHTPDMTHLPLALVEQHVDAMRAIAREHARADLGAIAGALTQKLREVTDDFLRAENADRPDYLERISLPPLAPGANGK